MAKRKKTKRKSTKRRRVSGIGGDLMQTVLGAVVGAVGGNLLVDKMAENMPSLKPNLVIAGQGLLGVLIAAKMKNPLAKAVGLGLVGAAGIKGAQSFGISGIGANSNLVTFSANPSLNGLQNSMAGYDEDLAGDGMAGLPVIAGMM